MLPPPSLSPPYSHHHPLLSSTTHTHQPWQQQQTTIVRPPTTATSPPCHLPPLVLTTTHNNGHMTTMETGGQWWHNMKVTMDDHNDNRLSQRWWTTEDYAKNMRWATTGNNMWVLPHHAAPPHSLLCSTSIFSKLDTYFPYASSYETSPQPVETETGWEQSFNQKKTTKTTLNQLTLVQSSFSWFFNLRGPVLVSVLSNLDKRLDWTRLPSTNGA